MVVHQLQAVMVVKQLQVVMVEHHPNMDSPNRFVHTDRKEGIELALEALLVILISFTWL